MGNYLYVEKYQCNKLNDDGSIRSGWYELRGYDAYSEGTLQTYATFEEMQRAATPETILEILEYSGLEETFLETVKFRNGLSFCGYWYDYNTLQDFNRTSEEEDNK